MLWREREVRLHLAQEPLADPHPVLHLPLISRLSTHITTPQQRLQFAPPAVRRHLLSYPLWTLQQPHRHVPAQEGHPLQQEAPRARHAHRVAAPVLQSVVAELLDDVQSLSRADVPVA